MRHFIRKSLVALAATALAVTTLPVMTAAAPALPTAVTAGALPTPQTDGIVFSVAIVGNTVYVGGRFTKARPAGAAAGTGEVTRNNLLAFNLTKGALLPWAPNVTGTSYSGSDPGPFCLPSGVQWLCNSVFRIKASPDGSKIYVGGDFDRIDGQSRSRIAAFDTATGALDTVFHPQVAGRVRGISVTANAVYLGGGFNAVNGTARTRFAALTPAGALLPWAPNADAEVFSVQADPASGKVLLGGAFNHVNGAAHRGLMEVDATTGANSPWSVTLPGTVSVVTDIETDGNGTAYFGAYNYGDGSTRFEGRAAVNIATGTAKWFDGCYGDTQSIAVSNNVIYSASHTHECDTLGIPSNVTGTYLRLLAESTDALSTSPVSFNGVSRGTPVPALLPWLPNTNGGPSTSYWKNGPWAMAANGAYVVAGGEFTTVNGTAQQSLTRFAARGTAGAVNNGPQFPFAAPVVTRRSASQISINWKATWDAQNSSATYYVYRVGTAAPIYSVNQASQPWNLPAMSYTDTSAPTGPVSYWIKAVDVDGASAGSPHGTSSN